MSVIHLRMRSSYDIDCGRGHTKFIRNRSKLKTMGAAAVPVVVLTVLWGVVGIVLPFVVPKGPNRGIFQVVLMLTAATCWLFWLCCYMAQMNPLIGPKMSNRTILLMAKEWGNSITH